jgi:UDP-2,4-diacetamido-2,4,6-trideoxy-beta-L-altropyranose hydrolase
MITFFVDGAGKQGLGHIYRSINLASTFSKKYKIKFLISKFKSKKNIKLLKIIFSKYEFKLKFITNNLSIEFEKDIYKNILFDHPKLKEKTINIAKKFYSKILIIDDENTLKKYNCDLLINQNAYSKKFKYKNFNKNQKKAIGQNYTILKEYPIKGKLRLKKNIKKILLLFGATDVKNYYKYLIQKLDTYKVFIPVNNSTIEEKVSKLKKTKNLKILRNISIRKIIINKKIDIVISCCGSSLYDLFSFKIPIIGIQCSDDQNNAHAFYSKKKAIIGSNMQNIQNDLNKLNYKKRIMLVKNSQKYYNFNGKYLLRNKIIKLINDND